jgi:histone acetyltransferase
VTGVAIAQTQAVPARDVVHAIMQNVRQCPESAYFLHLLSREVFPDYYRVVTTPMALDVIEAKLQQYAGVEELLDDLLLIVQNCRTFNAVGTKYHSAAATLEAMLLR